MKEYPCKLCAISCNHVINIIILSTDCTWRQHDTDNWNFSWFMDLFSDFQCKMQKAWFYLKPKIHTLTPRSRFHLLFPTSTNFVKWDRWTINEGVVIKCAKTISGCHVSDSVFVSFSFQSSNSLSLLSLSLITMPPLTNKQLHLIVGLTLTHKIVFTSFCIIYIQSYLIWF